MSAQVVSIVWWVFGSLGVGGLIAAWFLLPEASALVLQGVVKFFQLVLSYRIGCALLAAIVAGLIVDHQRHAYDDEQFAQRTAAFEAAQHGRDERIAKKTRDDVWTEIANQTAKSVETNKEVKGFKDALPPTPATGNVFRIGDSDAKRLCSIAYGKAGCGPDGRQGMPEARRKGRFPGDKGLGFPSAIRRIVGDD